MNNKVGEKFIQKVDYQSIFSVEQLAAAICSRLAFEEFIPLEKADVAKKFAMDELNVLKKKE